ncbi:MAG: apolipoprotein N-acyltransferase [Planctomycetota bacterium]
MTTEEKLSPEQAAAEAEKKRLLGIYVACGLSIGLFYASFHPLDLSFLAWFCLVPWMFVALRGSRRCAMVTSYGTTFLYHLLGLSWIGLVTAPGWVATTFLEGFYSLAIVMAVRFMRARTGLPVTVLLPPLWVMGEHSRGAHLWFIKFPWLLLGQTQHPNRDPAAASWLPQLADVTSIYGLSFLVVLVNAFILDVLLTLADKADQEKDLEGHERKRLFKLAAYPVLALVLALGYGAIRSGQVAGAIVKGPRLLAVQCDVPQDLKEDESRDPARELADENFALTRIALAGVAADQLPDAILWSETVWLYPFNYDYPDWRKFDDIWVHGLNQNEPPTADRPGRGDVVRAKNVELFKLADQYKADLLLGVYSRGDMEDWTRRGSEKHLANRVYKIPPSPKVDELKKEDSFYDKINLVPASEGIPRSPEWFYNLIRSFVPPGFQTLEPGSGPKVMTLSKAPHWKLSCDICFEISFPELLAEGTRKGADVLFCPSNDAWFHTPDSLASAEINLALDHAMFRAIESRRGLVRIVNRGITCFIDPLGHVVKAVEGKKRLRDGTTIKSELHVAESILGEVPTSRLTSLYVRFGDFFAWGCWIASFALMGFSLTRRPSPAGASS